MRLFWKISKPLWNGWVAEKCDASFLSSIQTPMKPTAQSLGKRALIFHCDFLYRFHRETWYVFSLQQHIHRVKVAKVMRSLVWLLIVRVLYFIPLRALIRLTEILGKEQSLWQRFFYWEIFKRKTDYLFYLKLLLFDDL